MNTTQLSHFSLPYMCLNVLLFNFTEIICFCEKVKERNKEV